LEISGHKHIIIRVINKTDRSNKVSIYPFMIKNEAKTDCISVSVEQKTINFLL